MGNMIYTRLYYLYHWQLSNVLITTEQVPLVAKPLGVMGRKYETGLATKSPGWGKAQMMPPD